MTIYHFYNPTTSFNFLFAMGCAAYPETIYIFNSHIQIHCFETTITAITHENIHLILRRIESEDASTKFDNIAKGIL